MEPNSLIRDAAVGTSLDILVPDIQLHGFNAKKMFCFCLINKQVKKISSLVGWIAVRSGRHGGIMSMHLQGRRDESSEYAASF